MSINESWYEVIVGNIGLVYDGMSKNRAEDTFDAYTTDSCLGIGRAAYETVTLMRDGEIIQEFTGEKDKEE